MNKKIITDYVFAGNNIIKTKNKAQATQRIQAIDASTVSVYVKA